MRRTVVSGLGALALAATAALTTGCSDILRVTNPGNVQDADLNNPAAAAGLVYGMSYQLSVALNSQIEQTGVVSQELFFTGSTSVYTNNGLVGPADDNGTWSVVQQARWVAEHGITRFQKSLGTQYGHNIYAARANLLAGIVERYMGETFCQTVIDGGPAQPGSVSFTRAAGYFTAAEQIDSANGDTSYIPAARMGLATTNAWMGNWSVAATLAAQVVQNDSGYEYDALYDATRGLTNDLASETHDRFAFSVFNTVYANQSHKDPRTPWDTVFVSGGVVQISADGHTPAFQQQKFADNSHVIAVIHWQEMLMLLAENSLNNGDVGGAQGFINRERLSYGITDTLKSAVTLDSTWKALRYDRGAVLWVEGRRLWDLARWNAATGPAHDGQLAGRAQCFPISSDERAANPNLH